MPQTTFLVKKVKKLIFEPYRTLLKNSNQNNNFVNIYIKIQLGKASQYPQQAFLL